MLQKLCPNGVEYKKIKDLYIRLKGTPITASKMKEIATDDGNVKIFAGGKTCVKAQKEHIPNANIITVPAVLVQSRGIVDAVYCDEPFTFKNEMWAYTSTDAVSVKFLFYILKSNIQRFRDEAKKTGSLPQISLNATEDFSIPIPPIEVQCEIVRILDNFSKLVTSITEGLPSEIEARQKQYEYYRDRLLNFKKSA